MRDAERFTAEQLAFRAGVPLRTVRFYVQEKLIDPPRARGRGAHFTRHHLIQLQQARTLHNSGFTLEAIREQAHDLRLGLAAMMAHDAARQRWRAHLAEPELGDAEQDPEDHHAPFSARDAMRIPMADGVDLLVSAERPLPSPKALVELALHIRKLFALK